MREARTTEELKEKMAADPEFRKEVERKREIDGPIIKTEKELPRKMRSPEGR
jgi:hypothetical protein